MKIALINKPSKEIAPIVQVLLNRGIKPQDMQHYLNTTDEDINSPELLGAGMMREAATALIKAIQTNEKAIVIVDCDCDGYTSAALIMNYLHDLFPAWVESNLDYFMHSGKQHGLNDCIDIAMNYKLVICPDSSSNDYEQHKQLKDNGSTIIILDHHEAERIPRDAVIMNNQLCDYPNKMLSGVGITWQFCRYLDTLLNSNNAENYIDLVALGNCGDMMSLLSIETAHLIRKGFQPDNIKNPFFYGMWQKNKFKLGDNPTPIGVAFYVVPFINAITRSGTQEEKKTIFESMLKWKAYAETLSTKRGHAFGEMERLVDQALRVATNVKNRQTKAETAGMDYLENMIQTNNLLDHKVLLFLLEDDVVPSTIRGLVANKFMAKYQRPVCVLTYHDGEYSGSARGYTASGIEDFKAICESTCLPEYATGHANAFGLSLNENRIANFITCTDSALADMTSEPVYRVDYILHEHDDIYMQEIIMSLASAQMYYGQDVSEPLLALLDVKISSDMVTLMKGNTLKITLPNGVPILKFGATEEEMLELTPQQGCVTVDFICRGNLNEWNGNITAQLMLVDFEIKKGVVAWDF